VSICFVQIIMPRRDIICSNHFFYFDLYTSATFSTQVSREETLSEDEHLKKVCSCGECIQNAHHCFSNKYETMMMQLMPFKQILESTRVDEDAYKKENPQMYKLMNMELPLNDALDVGADEGDGNDEAGSGEDDETRPSFLQPFQPNSPNSMPEDVVLFGLAAKTVSIMEKNCKTEAMTHFVALLDEAHRQFSNNTGRYGTISYDTIAKVSKLFKPV